MCSLARNVSNRSRASQGGQRDRFPESERAGDHALAEASEIVLVRSADFLDQAVQTQAFQQTGDLAAGLAQCGLQVPVAQAADCELASGEGEEEVQVIAVEQIEPRIASAVFPSRSGHFLDGPDARRVVAGFP